MHRTSTPPFSLLLRKWGSGDRDWFLSLTLGLEGGCQVPTILVYDHKGRTGWGEGSWTSLVVQDGLKVPPEEWKPPPLAPDRKSC